MDGSTQSDGTTPGEGSQREGSTPRESISPRDGTTQREGITQREGSTPREGISPRDGTTQREGITIGEKAKGIIGLNVRDAKVNEVAGSQNNYYFYGDASGLSPVELPLAAPCPTIEVPRLLPHLVNRSEQQDRLCDDLRRLLQREDQQTFLCIIPGDDTQCHEDFVNRIQTSVLREFPPLSACTKTITLPWPTHIKHPDALDGFLQRSLSQQIFGHGEASLQEIKNHVSQYAGVVLIRLYLLTEHLKDKGPQLLGRLVDFWRQWHDLGTCRCVFISLCIQYKTLPAEQVVQKTSLMLIWKRVILIYRQWRRNKIKKKTEQCLKSLEKEDSSRRHGEKLVLSVLPPLGAVGQGCVENWARSKEVLTYLADNKQQIGTPGGCDLIREIKRMYGHWETTTAEVEMPMDCLVDKLVNILRHNLRAG